jgi:hypothetical protein
MSALVVVVEANHRLTERHNSEQSALASEMAAPLALRGVCRAAARKLCVPGFRRICPDLDFRRLQ